MAAVDRTSRETKPCSLLGLWHGIYLEALCILTKEKDREPFENTTDVLTREGPRAKDQEKDQEKDKEKDQEKDKEKDQAFLRTKERSKWARWSLEVPTDTLNPPSTAMFWPVTSTPDNTHSTRTHRVVSEAHAAKNKSRGLRTQHCAAGEEQQGQELGQGPGQGPGHRDREGGEAERRRRPR